MRRSLGPIAHAALAVLLLAIPLVAAARNAAAPIPGADSGQDWRAFEPKGRQFRLALPPGWSVEQTAPAAPGAEFELALTLPGEALLDYAYLSVRHMASPHRTVERALFALRHPPFASPSAKAAALALEIRRETLSPGVEAWVAERPGERGLLGLADRVPVRKRTLIVPRPVGYFTLAMDVPEAALDRVLPVFERLAREFRPLAGAGERGPELSAAEREVWAAFFVAKGKAGGGKTGATLPEASAQPAAPSPAASGQTASGVGSALDQLAALAQASQAAPPLPAPPDEALRSLADTGRARLVAGRTLAAPGLDGAVLEDLVRGCGGGGAAELMRAWDAVRGQRVLVTDAILAPGLEPGLEVSEEPGPERPAKGGRKVAKARPAPPEDMAEPDELAERGELTGQAELMGRMSGQGRLAPASTSGLLFSGGQASLSRVAFSHDEGLALAYVTLRGVSPGLSHFVLFRRTGAPAGGEAEGGRGWSICGAALRDYIIY